MAVSSLRGGQAGAAERIGVDAGGRGAKTKAAVDAVAASLDPAVGSFEVALLENKSFGCAPFLLYVT